MLIGSIPVLDIPSLFDQFCLINNSLDPKLLFSFTYPPVNPSYISIYFNLCIPHCLLHNTFLHMGTPPVNPTPILILYIYVFHSLHTTLRFPKYLYLSVHFNSIWGMTPPLEIIWFLPVTNVSFSKATVCYPRKLTMQNMLQNRQLHPHILIFKRECTEMSIEVTSECWWPG